MQFWFLRSLYANFLLSSTLHSVAAFAFGILAIGLNWLWPPTDSWFRRHEFSSAVFDLCLISAVAQFLTFLHDVVLSFLFSLKEAQTQTLVWVSSIFWFVVAAYLSFIVLSDKDLLRGVIYFIASGALTFGAAKVRLRLLTQNDGLLWIAVRVLALLAMVFVPAALAWIARVIIDIHNQPF